MSEVTDAAPTMSCPGCGRPATRPTGRPDSGDFCSHCDYPLFFAPKAERSSAEDLDDESWVSGQRLPGTGGRAAFTGVPCPTCTEPNDPGADVCIRCGGPMVLPAPEPEPSRPAPSRPEPAPMPAPAVAQTEPSMPAWALYAVATQIAVVLVVAVVLALVR